MDMCFQKHLKSIASYYKDMADKQIEDFAIVFERNKEEIKEGIKTIKGTSGFCFEPILNEISKFGQLKRCVRMNGLSGSTYVFDLIVETKMGSIVVKINHGKLWLQDIIQFLTAAYDVSAFDWIIISYPTSNFDFSTYSKNIVEALDVDEAVEKLKGILYEKRESYNLQHNH